MVAPQNSMMQPDTICLNETREKNEKGNGKVPPEWTKDGYTNNTQDVSTEVFISTQQYRTHSNVNKRDILSEMWQKHGEKGVLDTCVINFASCFPMQKHAS